MNEFFRQIISGLAAAFTLAALVSFSSYLFWFSLAISAAIGVGTYFSIPRKKDAHETEIAPGVTQAMLNAAIRHINAQVSNFSRLSAQIQHSGIRSLIQEITDILSKTGQILRENPEELDSTSARLFLDQFLNRSHDVISQYVRLLNTGSAGLRGDSLNSAKEAIVQIRSGFQGFYRQCLEKDLTNLETEVETLKALSEMDFPDINPEERSRQ